MAKDSCCRNPEVDSQLSPQMPGSHQCTWWTHTLLTVIEDKNQLCGALPLLCGYPTLRLPCLMDNYDTVSFVFKERTTLQ